MDTTQGITWEQEKESGIVETVTRKRLIDALNYVNFQKQSIIVTLEHAVYGKTISLRAFPDPCMDGTLACSWAEACPSNIDRSYIFRSFLVDRGENVLTVKAEAQEMTQKGVRVTLPEHCQALYQRKVRRYAADGIVAGLASNSVLFRGVLEDFSTVSLRVSVSAIPPQTFLSLNPDDEVYVMLFDGDEPVYSGECRIIRQTDSRRERTFVLILARPFDCRSNRDRFKTSGYVLTPRPVIVFKHPFTKKEMSLELDEISRSWFTIVEYYDRAVLLPGLVLPEVELQITSGFSITCRAQVTSGEVSEVEERKIIKWRTVVLDMGMEDQGNLFALLWKIADEKSHACGRIELDDLLRFFFATGFVYPKKYVSIQPYSEQFKETYKKLYLESPTIARHFVCQDKGAIQGHLSMVRFYENTWLIQHHAAIGQHAAGLAVLGQITDYIEDYGGFYSSHMDFLICYFRPDNKFPERVFGGFTRALDNPAACSLDAFAYLNLRLADYDSAAPASGWSTAPAGVEDLIELRNFYDYTSGGLMTRAMDLDPDAEPGDLDEEYERLGFKRQKHVIALKKDGALKAVIMVTVSDVGLNMSNLTNCIHVFVTDLVDPGDLPVAELYRRLASLRAYYAEEEVSVLLYPLAYAQKEMVPYEKVYQLMTLDSRYIGHFRDHMRRLVPRRKQEAVRT